MKLIHLSDFRLDRSFVAASLPPEVCNACRDGLKAALEQAFKHAVEVNADAVLLAGNLLESARYLPTTLRWLKERVEALGDIPVLVAAGDCDPLTSGSPYVRGIWPENIHFFGDTWSTWTLPDRPLAVMGCAKAGVESTLPDFPSEDWDFPEHYKVVMGHVAPTPEAQYGLKPAMASALEHAHYLALGGAAPESLIVEDAPACIGYPGMLPAEHAEEAHRPSFLEVLLQGETPEAYHAVARPIPINSFVFVMRQVVCDEDMTGEQLLKALESMIDQIPAPPEHLVLRLALGGVLTLKVRGMLPDIQDTLAETVHYAELLDETKPQSFYSAYAHNDSTLGRFLRRIGQEIEDAPDQRRRRVLCRAREAGWVAFHQETPFPANGVEEDIL